MAQSFGLQRFVKFVRRVGDCQKYRKNTRPRLKLTDRNSYGHTVYIADAEDVVKVSVHRFCKCLMAEVASISCNSSAWYLAPECQVSTPAARYVWPCWRCSTPDGGYSDASGARKSVAQPVSKSVVASSPSGEYSGFKIIAVRLNLSRKFPVCGNHA